MTSLKFDESFLDDSSDDDLLKPSGLSLIKKKKDAVAVSQDSSVDEFPAAVSSASKKALAPEELEEMGV
jgi:hypothetical protein